LHVLDSQLNAVLITGVCHVENTDDGWSEFGYFPMNDPLCPLKLKENFSGKCADQYKLIFRVPIFRSISACADFPLNKRIFRSISAFSAQCADKYRRIWSLVLILNLFAWNIFINV
jgi:hypothetical protein